MPRRGKVNIKRFFKRNNQKLDVIIRVKILIIHEQFMDIILLVANIQVI